MEKEHEQRDLFHEVNEGYTILEAINEAKRCLHCKVPSCRKGCPISQDIPDWINEISKGNFGNAMKIINDKSNLPFAGACAPTRSSVKATVCSPRRAKAYMWASWSASSPTSMATWV